MLLLAAGMKGYDLLVPRIMLPGARTSFLGETALVVVEVLLGLWLLSWLAVAGRSSLVVLLWLMILCGVSLYEAVSGRGLLCGCFGVNWK